MLQPMMCVGVFFYFSLSLMYFRLQKKLKRKKKTKNRRPRSVGKTTVLTKRAYPIKKWRFLFI